ncbi:MAG TPA: glycosyltransferase family 2 protein, partial [Candidatus Sumerlaeota bacterium]|nr:glycosyltransferase family 2 protein [Candidatus Sumerlaeota bacterium]
METPAHIPEVSVIVPVYNDKDSLPSVIEGIRKAMSGVFDTEIIVVDDGSTDGLSQDSIPGAVRFHRHSENMGYGAAIKTGLRHALGSCVVIMDADGTYPAEAIPALVRALDDCDMSVGARTGATVHIPLVRQ